MEKKYIPMSPEMAEAVKRSLERMTKNSLIRLKETESSNDTYVLQKYADMARTIKPDLIPKRISCHSLRHSRAMHLLQAGVNLVYIRDILGHVSIQTTDIYARADSKAKREALEKAYTDLTPNRDSDKSWESNKNLRDWLRGLKK